MIQRLCNYLDDSPTPHHAVRTTIALLEAHGFNKIDRTDPPASLASGFRGYVEKGGSLVAFHVGTDPVTQAGFRMVNAHTDSPNLRIKPQPYLRSHGYLRLGVEAYGGVLQATWADRDLGMAGLVTVRSSGGLRTELVRFDTPVCRIPNLAIHLNRDVNKKGLVLNAQTQLPVLLSLDNDDEDPLRSLIGAQLDIAPNDVLTWDLSLYDLTSARVTGAHDEFLCSARLDNLASCHAGLEALLGSLDDVPRSTSVLALFDHEEVGSRSARGADSRTLEDVLRLILAASNTNSGSFSGSLAHSWLVSADMAHAVHPSHPEMHDSGHMPSINRGPVIKQNANQHYGTEAETAAMFLLLCERTETPMQWFVNRSDLACGFTVGPILAAQLGVRTIDVGNPMLSMHSVREMCGTQDHPAMVRVLRAFFSSPQLS